MMSKQKRTLQKTMENIVADPKKATVVVGCSILFLLLIIEKLSALFPPIRHFKWVVPFIPPFFITKTAKRINLKRAEHDFIKDAEPYVFVAYPKKATKESLLSTSPDIVSDSASRHLGLPMEKIMSMGSLTTHCFTNHDEIDQLTGRLIDDFNKNDGYGVIRNFRVSLKTAGKENDYIMNSVLKLNNDSIKWQATLMKLAN